MTRMRLPVQGRASLKARRALLPACESLEGRVVLNAASTSHLTAEFASKAAIHASQANSSPVIGIITGTGDQGGKQQGPE